MGGQETCSQGLDTSTTTNALMRATHALSRGNATARYPPSHPRTPSTEASSTSAVDEINATGLEPQLSMLAVHKGHARGQSSMSAVALQRTRAVRTPRQATALPNSGCPASSLHAHGGRGPGWGWEHTQGGSAWPSRAGGTCAPPRRCRRTAHVPRTEQAHHTHLFHHLNLDSSLILVTLALGLHASTSGPCKTQLRRAAPRQRHVSAADAVRPRHDSATRCPTVFALFPLVFAMLPAITQQHLQNQQHQCPKNEMQV